MLRGADSWDPPATSKHRPAWPVVREVASKVTLQAKCTQGPGAGWPDPPGVSQEVPTMAGSCSQGPSLQGPTGRAPKIKPARPAGAVARLHTPESGSAGRPNAPGGAILARLSRGHRDLAAAMAAGFGSPPCMILHGRHLLRQSRAEAPLLFKWEHDTFRRCPSPVACSVANYDAKGPYAGNRGGVLPHRKPAEYGTTRSSASNPPLWD